jgi:hypothetical protein
MKQKTQTLKQLHRDDNIVVETLLEQRLVLDEYFLAN